MILTYYCQRCNKNQFQYVPVCQIDKEYTNCKYCGRKIKLSEGFLDSILDKISEAKKMAEELHEDLTEVHETLNGMKGEII